VKALSLTQPWATLIAIGAKRIETRSWSTTFRGPVAIHAAKSMPLWAREFAYADPAGRVLNRAGILLGNNCAALPRGAIVALAELVAVAPTHEIVALSHGALPLLPHEIEFGDYTDGRYGWVLSNVVPLSEPVACKGALGLWEVPGDVLRQIQALAAV
jgi:activating signal cointegrator 1